MFGFIERRVLKEHMKLVAQSYSALSYLVHFCPHTSVSGTLRSSGMSNATGSPAPS